MPDLPTILLLGLAALCAGFVDAAAGGGGLILVPSLLLALPGAPVPVILGTNKAASVTGTTFAAAAFARARLVPGRSMVLAALAGLSGALAGVQLALRLSSAFLRPLMLLLLTAMLGFSLLRPRLGELHAPRAHGHAMPITVAASLIVGFYDGFFGPGAGVLLLFAFVTLLGFDFLRASALAKSANWGSNVGAAAVLLAGDHWLPGLAAVLIVGNIAGGLLGARLAIARGNRWIRRLFTGVVAALLVRLAWQTLG